MNCPYCGKEMVEGKVTFPPERFSYEGQLQWYAPSVGGKRIGLNATEADLLFDKRLVGPGWFCPDCNKILCEMTPLPPREGLLDLAARKLGELGEKIEAAEKAPKAPKGPPRSPAGEDPWEIKGRRKKPEWED